MFFGIRSLKSVCEAVILIPNCESLKLHSDGLDSQLKVLPCSSRGPEFNFQDPR